MMIDPQDDHSGGRKWRPKRPETAIKRRFIALIFTVIRHPFLRAVFLTRNRPVFFRRISIHFWNDGLRRRFLSFIVVSGRLRRRLLGPGSEKKQMKLI